MDRDLIREREARCLAEQPPACTATCPVHVDARGMIDHLRRGDFDGALASFVRSVPFPRTLARVCDRPCEHACRRAEAGETVAIGELERACVAHGKPPASRRAGRAVVKDRRVAVVGGGLSGLTATCDLAFKGFGVVLFEAGPRLGGRLLELSEAQLPAQALEADLEQLTTLGVELRLSSPVQSALALTDEFDAVIAATGASTGCLDGLELTGDGQLRLDPLTGATSHPKVFGAPPCASPIFAVHLGRRAASSIDRLFQKASLTFGREQEGPFKTRLFTRTAGLTPAPQVPVPSSGYARDEAVAEATRCIACSCRECLDACPFLAHHGSYPKRYIREIYNNDCIVLGQHKANRLANTCALCGLCAEVCPEKLGMAETCREARESMVAKGKMPPSTHEFALRDLEFSQGPDFALARNAPGTTHSEVVFFPGCHLSASSPEQVEKVYALLRQQLGPVGLHLGCCGAPAQWAGRKDLAASTLAAAKATWAGLGARRVITACPSCTLAFRTGCPELEVDSLWTVLAGLELPAGPQLAEPLAIHDPCSARHDRPSQDAARALLERRGVTIVEPAYTREKTTCCSFGGLMSFANPAVAEKLVRQRLAERDADYVTYCAMCRDNFAARGKPTLHLLDVLFGEAGARARKPPGFSQRRRARQALKARLLAGLWASPLPQGATPMDLSIDDTVAAQLEQRLILQEEVEAAIAAAEHTGEKLIKRSNGHFIASYRPAKVTYWVEYSPRGAGFTVHAVWSHRMELSGGTAP